MQEQNKKPPEYYKSDITYLDFYIKRNFSDAGRNIGVEYQSCFVTISKEQITHLLRAMGENNEIMLTGKGWLNDISDPNKSNLHVELVSHSQNDIDYLEKYNERKQSNNFQSSTSSDYVNAKNNSNNDQFVTENDYTNKVTKPNLKSDMDDDIPF